ncbi:MAG: hypothetical protein ACRETA_04410 [Gammaproteobacteria bacterium]
MAKRSEKYIKRIRSALKRGRTYQQARGHGREEALRLENPFVPLKEQLDRMLGRVNAAFEPLMVVPGYAGVEYYPGDRMHRAGWFTGTERRPANRQDFADLFDEANEKRPQNGYAVLVTGITEDEYPGHEGEIVITLSYRLNRSTIEDAIDNRSNMQLKDVVNDMIGPRDEKWLVVYSVMIVDKE